MPSAPNFSCGTWFKMRRQAMGTIMEGVMFTYSIAATAIVAVLALYELLAPNP